MKRVKGGKRKGGHRGGGECGCEVGLEGGNCNTPKNINKQFSHIFPKMKAYK